MTRVIFSVSAMHALRAVASLGADAKGAPVLGRDLARRLKIPPDYLAKVLATLARSGVLSAVRGARGGYRLARDPARIRLLEVVKPFEGSRVKLGCLMRPGRPCRGDGACPAHASWSTVRESFEAFLDGNTVADIMGTGRSPGRGARGPDRGPRGRGRRKPA